MENKIPVYLLQGSTKAGLSVDDVLLGEAVIVGDHIEAKIHGFPFTQEIERLTDLGEIRGLFVTVMFEPSARTMIGLRHKGALGCPVEGCDGQTCEEGETS